MFLKDPYSMLAEAADMDLSISTSTALTESQINTVMESFDEVDEDVVYTAEMVSVIKVGDDYLTEMNSIYPYMQSNGITSVAEALNDVARINGLQEKSVGLLIDSDDKIESMMEAAKKKGGKAKEGALDKIKKATKIPAKLKKEGFPVKKKKSCKKEGCAKEGSEPVDEFKSDIKRQNSERELLDKMSGSHNKYVKQSYEARKKQYNLDKAGKNYTRPADSKGAKVSRDIRNTKRVKANDHEKDRIDAINKKEKEDRIRRNNESAMFDFDLK